MNEFNKDYQDTRLFEPKYFYMALEYLKYFEPISVLDYGCGKGFLIHALKYCQFDGFIQGFDISKEAIDEAYQLAKGSLTTDLDGLSPADLVICQDTLEHIPEEQLDATLKILQDLTLNNILVIVPVIGNPDLENDPTHKIFKTEQWWRYKLSQYFDIIPNTPRSLPFWNITILGKKKEVKN